MKRWLCTCAIGLWSMGCVKAPALVVVDRATVLEQQAGGSFEQIEKKLAAEAIALRPVALTPAQLATLGLKPTTLDDGADETDADRVDALLKQRCVGEGREGLLVDTREHCLGAANHAQTIELISKTNSARAQLFRWMHAQRPEVPIDELRRSWREQHARGVVCGSWQQRDDGTWEAKKC